jgi:hypothetical protein
MVSKRQWRWYMAAEIKEVSPSVFKELRDKLHGMTVYLWYELSGTTGEAGTRRHIGYYADKDVATAAGRRKGWSGSDGVIDPVLVISADGKTGFLVNPEQVALMSDEAEQREAAISRALEKLTPEERALLNIRSR